MAVRNALLAMARFYTATTCPPSNSKSFRPSASLAKRNRLAAPLLHRAMPAVPTFRLNEAVKRNNKRFPEDFMFQLTAGEWDSLTSQKAISKPGRGGRRTLPYAFTEHGVAMLSSVLNNERAIAMNILIVRAFIKLREVLASQKDLAARIENLESHQRRHASVINILADEIEQLKTVPAPSKRPIGFPSARVR